MTFGKDPSDFRLSLKIALKEHCGPRNDHPYRLGAGARLMDLLNRELGEEHLLAFLRCAQTASLTFQTSAQRLNLYSSHLSRALEAAGLPEAEERWDVAWALLLTLHQITGQEHFDLLITCGIEALEYELAPA